MIKLRPAVRWWAERMEEELRKNEHKGGWFNSSVSFFLGRARANLKEIAYGGYGQESGNEFITKCLADCSNYCMMAADNLNRFTKECGKDRY